MASKVILMVVSLVLSGFFSSSETALFSLSRMYLKKLENSKKWSSRYIPQLLKHPQQLLITILLSNTVVNVTFASLAAMIALDITRSIPGRSAALALVVEIILATVIVLIFGEVVPKVFAIKYAEKYSTVIAIPIGFFKIILFPVVKILELFTNIFTKGTDRGLMDSNIKITSEDIKSIVYDEAPDMVDIHKEEREMLNSAFEFSDTKVKEILTPRIDITAVEIEDGIENLIRVIKESGFSRIPIYRGTIDNIIGMVYSKDIILNLGSQKRIKDLMRLCYFIPENMKLIFILNYFRKNKIHLAVVVDEYGGTTGLVTLEDVLEEIVGEILDETDVEKIEIKPITQDEYIIDCSTDFDDVCKKFGLEVDDQFDSFSGFLYNLFGKIPQQGETVIFKDKYKFTVESIDGQRIKNVRLNIL
ncbi:MAG: hemolysin family protein [Candidatus Celaenobacter antarcticus]|nr:hemolysin family protein [Candidatus Celaenobacter antarcticus]MDP8314155.1 hemolysin family protein [Candidatus Celaenobacter antarcticus]